MSGARSIEVTSENLGHIDFGGAVALEAAAKGAASEPGRVAFFTADGTQYQFDPSHGGLTPARFYKAFPGCPLDPSSPSKPWREFCLGDGNSLYLHERAYAKYQTAGRSSDPEDVVSWWRSVSGKPLLTKEERYTWLIEEARASYPQAGRPGELVWCGACREEINLWTYWQGRGCLDPDILVVGQDWGNPDTPKGRSCLEAIEQGTPYLSSSTFPTDQRLAELFKAVWPDIGLGKEGQKNERLFFTNLVLGYRTGKNTGPLKAAQFKHDLGYFKTLVHILRPRAVICLGQKTFTYALRAFGERMDFPDGYISALDAHENYIDLDGTRFYGMSHCGNYGCKNRGGNVSKGRALQIRDWMEMKKLIAR